MNIHVHPNTRKDWTGFEFVGKPFSLFGKQWIRAKERTTGRSGYYSYERDIIMMDSTCRLYRTGRFIDLL